MNHPVDMSHFIAPKSDQINADDLISGPLTITVSRVSANEGAPEQPINIGFENDDGKPFRPCKSMRRVMVHIWGADATKYVGRSMTLYRDPKVQFGGMQVGGIRISHMTDIPADKLSDGKVQMALTASKAKRAPYSVFPLKVEPRQDKAAQWVTDALAAVAQCPVLDALDSLTSRNAAAMGKLQGSRPDLHAQVIAAYEAKRATFSAAKDDDPFDPDTGEVSDTVTDWTAFVEGINGRIAGAADASELDAINDDVAESGLPESDVAGLDVAIARKRRELAKG